MSHAKRFASSASYDFKRRARRRSAPSKTGLKKSASLYGHTENSVGAGDLPVLLGVNHQETRRREGEQD